MSHYTAWKVGRVFLFPCRRNNCSIWGLKSFSDTNLLLSKKKKKKACGRNLDPFPLLPPWPHFSFITVSPGPLGLLTGGQVS